MRQILRVASTLVFTLRYEVSASFLRGEQHQRRILPRQCVFVTDETLCVEDEACTWCEFKYDVYQPTCLPKKSLSSLPTIGFHTCNAEKQQQQHRPTPDPTLSRNGIPDRPDTMITSSPSSTTIKTTTTLTPSADPSESRRGGPPLNNKVESDDEDENDAPCYFWNDETDCVVNRSCTWCDFRYDAYAPVCLKKKDVSSLPAGFYACRVQQRRTVSPTLEPTRGRSGANSRPEEDLDNATTTSTTSSSFPSSSSSATPSAVPTFSRNGATPTDGFDSSTAPAPSPDFAKEEEVEAPLESCYDAREESQCRSQGKTCRWCEFKYGAYEPHCLERKDLSSLPAGFYTCT